MEEPNFTYLNSLTAGDKAFEEKILKIIITEFPEEKNLYLNNIILNKLDQAANNVHKIKHKISLLGLEQSYGLASQHELNLINDNSILHEDFTEILNTINRFLKEL
ncbi:Hpt domain-containing protein [Flavobacterium petrolei]|jgi:HPt (histidine-containing phosphotransfer) domain-containing protein|uniref:Hpt domain-containing protein n=1 Tax=Flavobacterium petrolei TaxID=2259594 RepID=A0A482TKN3_9FLAO|nr:MULTISPECIES: Hpt domain-containing protein [Flavobacterium]QIH39017.1 Hpt domain-containing protein [Flavobacterium sp. Sr18]RYJ53325.1 Hpt domain-containing protein [Flavobacterium petrolei]